MWTPMKSLFITLLVVPLALSLRFSFMRSNTKPITFPTVHLPFRANYTEVGDDAYGLNNKANSVEMTASATVECTDKADIQNVANPPTGQEDPALCVLESTADGVAESRAAREEIRQQVLHIKAELARLSAVASISIIDRVLNMFALGTTKNDDVIAEIQSGLGRILDDIISKELSEAIALNNQIKGCVNEWNATSTTQTPLPEQLKTAALRTLDANIARAQGALNSTKSALQDEIDNQLRKASLMTQLLGVFEAIPGQDGEISVKADSGHTNLSMQFEQLRRAVEAEMAASKKALQAKQDREEQHHAELVSRRAAVALETEQAETAEQITIVAEHAKNALGNGEKVDDTEPTMVSDIMAMIANLASW